MKILAVSLALLALLGCAHEDRAAATAPAAATADADRLFYVCYLEMREKTCAMPTAEERESCMDRLAATLSRVYDPAIRRDLAVEAGCPERLAKAVR